MNDLKKMNDIGFEEAGEWKNNDSDKKKFEDGISDKFLYKNLFLYAYLVDNKVYYIGKSERTPKERIRNGWARNKSKKNSSTGGNFLKDAIDEGKIVKIWFWFPDFSKYEVKTTDNNISPSEIEEAAKNGIISMLEKIIIKKFNPEWNKTHKNHKTKK